MRFWLAGVVAVAGCGRIGFDATGDAAGPPGGWGQPVRIEELRDPANDISNPTLSENELEIFFIARASGMQGDIYTAQRASKTDPWGARSLVSELNSGLDESGLHLGRDPRVMYFSSARTPNTGMHDIYRVTRPMVGATWNAPVEQLVVSTTVADTSPAVDGAELYMVFNRGPSMRDFWQSTRPNTVASWGTATVQVELSSMADDGGTEISADGLTFYGNSGRSGNSDLFVASRPTASEPFEPPVPIDELNTPGQESTPWISADQRVIYFTSDRGGGEMELYRAER